MEPVNEWKASQMKENLRKGTVGIGTLSLHTFKLRHGDRSIDLFGAIFNKTKRVVRIMVEAQEEAMLLYNTDDPTTTNALKPFDCELRALTEHVQKGGRV